MTKDGFDFSFDEFKCGECDGSCCIGESGYIWVTPKEMTVIAGFLNIEVEDFKEKYLIKVGYRYSIKERQTSQNNYECIFFDNFIRGCKIYLARLNQCKTYPFWDYFKTNREELLNECKAIKVKSE